MGTETQVYECVEEYAGDIEAYGVDCIVGNWYYVTPMQDCSEYYVTTESGSDVQMTQKEVSRTFGI